MKSNIIKSSIFYLLVLLISGCSNKIYTDFINEDKLYEQSLLYTKKGEIVSSFETKSVIVATYINPLDESFNSKQKDSFLVAVYSQKEFGDDKVGLEKKECLIYLKDGRKPLEIEKLKKENHLLKYIPVHNGWFKYYLVTFAAKQEKKVTLVCENKRFGKTLLTFSKEE